LGLADTVNAGTSSIFNVEVANTVPSQGFNIEIVTVSAPSAYKIFDSYNIDN
jgi:hypothetical protein